MGAQGAVDGALDAAHREVVVGVADHARRGEPLGELGHGLAEHHPHAHVQLAAVRHAAQELGVLEGAARVLEGGHALAQALLHGVGGHLARVRAAGAEVGGLQEVGRGLAEGAGGGAARVADDLASLRRRGVPVDAAELHGLGVREGGVAAGVGQDHRVLGGGGGEVLVARQPVDGAAGGGGPLLLVPAAAADEGPGLEGGGGLGHQRHDLVPGLRLPQVELHGRVAHAEEVAVPLDEAGDREAPLEVDDPRLLADQPSDLGLAPHGEDAVPAHGDGLPLGAGGVHGDHAAAREDEVRELAGVPLLEGCPLWDGGYGGEEKRSQGGEDHQGAPSWWTDRG